MAYIRFSKLEWPHLWNELGMQKDKGGRWRPGEDTPQFVIDYLRGYRSPSRAYVYTYAMALLTQKFARHLAEQDPELAQRCGVDDGETP